MGTTQRGRRRFEALTGKNPTNLSYNVFSRKVITKNMVVHLQLLFGRGNRTCDFRCADHQLSYPCRGL